MDDRATIGPYRVRLRPDGTWMPMAGRAPLRAQGFATEAEAWGWIEADRPLAPRLTRAAARRWAEDLARPTPSAAAIAAFLAPDAEAGYAIAHALWYAAVRR